MIVMCWRQVGNMIDGIWVHAVAAWRLERDEDIAKSQSSQGDGVVMYIRLTRWFSPALLHLLLVTCRQICKPLSITRVRDMCCCLSKLSLGKQLSIIRAAINQCMDQRIATLWNTFDAIACLTHGLQQVHQRCRCIKPYSIANACGLCR